MWEQQMSMNFPYQTDENDTRPVTHTLQSTMCHRYHRYYVALIGILTRICFVLIIVYHLNDRLLNTHLTTIYIGGWVGMFMGCGVLSKFQWPNFTNRSVSNES